jgi:hypothetical protein
MVLSCKGHALGKYPLWILRPMLENFVRKKTKDIYVPVYRRGNGKNKEFQFI